MQTYSNKAANTEELRMFLSLPLSLHFSLTFSLSLAYSLSLHKPTRKKIIAMFENFILIQITLNKKRNNVVSYPVIVEGHVIARDVEKVEFVGIIQGP